MDHGLQSTSFVFARGDKTKRNGRRFCVGTSDLSRLSSPFVPSAAAGGPGGGGRAFSWGSRKLPVLCRAQAVFTGPGRRPGAGPGWAGLLDHHHVVLAVLAQVQLGKVEAFHGGGLQLRVGGGGTGGGMEGDMNVYGTEVSLAVRKDKNKC